MHVNLKFHKDFTSCLLSVESKEHDRLVPLELLGGGDPITSGFVGQPFVIKVPHHNNILLSSLGGILGGDNGLAVTSVRCVLLKFFPNSELELDALDGGLGDHGPVAPLLGDGHHWGGGQGSLPKDEPHTESLQKVLILLARSLCVCSCDGGHFYFLVLLGWCLDVQSH